VNSCPFSCPSASLVDELYECMCVCVYACVRVILADFILPRDVYRFKLIMYHICTKTMSVKGGVYVHEAYEAKKIKIKFAI
jgi:hypothetical protein